MIQLVSDAPTPPPPPPPPPETGYQMLPPANLPTHEHASLSLGLGIVGLLGLCTCGAGFLISPFALGYGLSSRRAIREHPDQWSGDGVALTGVILGAIGVALLVLTILAALVFAILVMNGTIEPSSDGGFST